MAENTNEKKFFLDLGGLKKLWHKISDTFANKAEVNESLQSLDSNIKTVTGNLQNLDKTVNARIDGVEDTIVTFMPREYQTYTDAVNNISDLAPGTSIKILEDSQLLDSEGNPIPDENGEIKTYKAGIYIVIDPEKGIIEKISTASGAGDGENVEDLAASLNQLSSDAVKSAVIVDSETGTQLSSINKENNTLIFKVDNEFKVNTDSVNLLTHKAIAAMFGTLSDQITQIPKFKISVVDRLPENNISTSTIYLVRNEDTSSNNLYTEYIYVSNGNSGDWEKLGEQSLVIDDFAKKTDVERMIAIAMQDVVKTNDLTTAIATAKGEILTEVKNTYITKEDSEKYIDQDELNLVLNDYYIKDDADAKFLTQAIADSLYVKNADIEGFMTETDIIASVQTGNIGEAIRITDEQINQLSIQ